MPSNDQYALMAGAAYASTRAVANQIPAPAGWYVVDQRIDDQTGEPDGRELDGVID